MSDKPPEPVIIEVGFHSIAASTIGSISYHEGYKGVVPSKPSATVNYTLGMTCLTAQRNFETVEQAQEEALRLRREWKAAISGGADTPADEAEPATD